MSPVPHTNRGIKIEVTASSLQSNHLHDHSNLKVNSIMRTCLCEGVCVYSYAFGPHIYGSNDVLHLPMRSSGAEASDNLMYCWCIEGLIYSSALAPTTTSTEEMSPRPDTSSCPWCVGGLVPNSTRLQGHILSWSGSASLFAILRSKKK